MTISQLSVVVVSFLLAAVVGPEPLTAQYPNDAFLPPAPAWDGASRALVADPENPWITPAERSGLTATPGYQETVDWLARLAAASDRVNLVTLGRSHEGRSILMVVASAEGAETPDALRANGRPTLLAQAGIHSGEIDGKDAGLMLLRELSVGGRMDLLERVNLLFVPILNVDGHERSGPFNRINQRGPLEMGWRTNARNQNLNRDYAKLDTPELRALIAAIGRWQPDLYFDLHVTDGADYQYDITWSHSGNPGYSPAIGAWLEQTLDPALEENLREAGHVPAPFLIFLRDAANPAAGAWGWMPGPRYSDGYGDARHLPTVLVENHSLKPYDRRVLGTYVLLETALDVLAESGSELRQAVDTDRARRPGEVPLSWRMPETGPATIEFLGVESRVTRSEITGGRRVAWTGEPVTMEIPWFRRTVIDQTVTRPLAYWIPPAWSDVIERLEIHGVQVERIGEARTVEVEVYRVDEPQLATSSFEGRVRLDAAVDLESRTVTYPAGSARVSTDQPLGDLAVLLLEPNSQDSFFRWGFFLEVLQRTEYMESYAIEAMAERMFAEDPELASRYRGLVADSTLANPRARLQWLYGVSPYPDDRWRVYPVGREVIRNAAD